MSVGLPAPPLHSVHIPVYHFSLLKSKMVLPWTPHTPSLQNLFDQSGPCFPTHPTHPRGSSLEYKIFVSFPFMKTTPIVPNPTQTSSQLFCVLGFCIRQRPI